MDFRLERGLTLEEAINMAYNDDIDPVQIYIEPPEPNVLTDEDSGDEDDGALVDNLNRQQLRSQVEIVLPDTDKIDGSQNNVVNENLPGPLQIEHERPGKNKITWVNGDIEPRTTNFPNPNYSRCRDLTFIEIFENFIDNDIIKFLVEESTRYALLLNEADPKISPEEMKCFIAILYLTGYCKLPGRDYYWDSREDMNNHMVSQAMRRDRFRQILKYLHSVVNTMPVPNDKMWKLRPLMNKVKANFVKNWEAEKCFDFDESMIKYFGRHSCKQFIRGKPIRFGYKMWCLNTPSGYLVNFDLYQGKNPYDNPLYENEFGKCIAPLINMIFNVLHYLKIRGFDGTGTIKDNRLPQSCPLPSKTVFKKNKKRGEYSSSLDKEDGIIVVKWLGNAPVSAASTCHGVLPISQVKRYSQSEKKIIQINRPSIITEYNRFMGGTDLLDENMNRYRISIRRKKWWWAIFTWLLDASMTNAWDITRKAKSVNVSQLKFRRDSQFPCQA